MMEEDGLKQFTKFNKRGVRVYKRWANVLGHLFIGHLFIALGVLGRVLLLLAPFSFLWTIKYKKPEDK